MTQPRIRCTLEPVSGDPGAALVVLGPSLGTTTALWDEVAARLAQGFRVLRFDLPGHGFSPAARDPFTITELADAVVALVDSVGGGAFHYAGISLGGTVGLELALRHPDRLLSLAVICSGARIGTADGWRERAAQIRASGTPSVVAGSADRWFAPGFLDRDPAAGSAALERLLDVDDESYALACEALAGFDVTDRVAGIRVPTLCVAGELDQVTPLALLADLAARIPGARLATVDGAAHLPSLERPVDVAALLAAHLADREPAEAPARTTADVYRAGMTVRTAVLGEAYVDAATAKITPETADFQDFITRYAWGEVWTRPGLDRRTRSFLTIACLVTGGHEQELALHVRAALTNGLGRAEIGEAILHTAIYAGVPAANSALAVARDVFELLDAEPAADPDAASRAPTDQP
ncbi:alpha/beta fold hydrolase [Cryobacterium mannosilyticum]|uniref:Alpha/beta fold hydrolase n=1 Tax=Cryobacterium mannosilyticum TaxID=1259190 RepID=A0A4R8W6L8_9MICO|nr:alpha/beta fold hydrolase [Cryobacterium mannosilyticum]TFC01729.1 alpha/beta fold hydrolase [Cryobacterium mannosilyticum]